MADESPFRHLFEAAGEQAAEQAMAALAASIGGQFRIDERTLKEIVDKTIAAWVTDNIRPVILAELDARRDEILAAVAETCKRVPHLVQIRLEEIVVARTRDKYDANNLVKALFGV